MKSLGIKNIIEYNKNVDLEKNIIVNYSCFCNKHFYAYEKLLYFLLCCHIVYHTCFNNYILKLKRKTFFVFKVKSNQINYNTRLIKMQGYNYGGNQMWMN